MGRPYDLTGGPLLKVSNLGESNSVPKKEAAVVLSSMSDVTFHRFFCIPFDERETPGPGLHKGVETRRR